MSDEPKREDTRGDERRLRDLLASQGVPAAQHGAQLALLSDEVTAKLVELESTDRVAAAALYRQTLLEHAEKVAGKHQAAAEPADDQPRGVAAGQASRDTSGEASTSGVAADKPAAATPPSADR
ncbi:MAG: hypothetical protein AAF805_00090 [Planctomycetota bacterium]